jgi:hypothetical protein
VKTTLGEVYVMNPSGLFDPSLLDDAEVSFVPMAAIEEQSGRLPPQRI